MTTALSERPATLPDQITFNAPIPGFPADRDFDVCPLDANGVLFALRSRQTPGLAVRGRVARVGSSRSTDRRCCRPTSTRSVSATATRYCCWWW